MSQIEDQAELSFYTQLDLPIPQQNLGYFTFLLEVRPKWSLVIKSYAWRNWRVFFHVLRLLALRKLMSCGIMRFIIESLELPTAAILGRGRVSRVLLSVGLWLPRASAISLSKNTLWKYPYNLLYLSCHEFQTKSSIALQDNFHRKL